MPASPFAIILALAAGTISPASAQGDMRVWVADSLTSVKRDDLPTDAARASIKAARNEFVGFQLAVRAPSGGALRGVNVSISDLRGPAVISGASIRLYREQYVPVRVKSPPSRAWKPNYANYRSPNAPRDWADALVPSTIPGGTYESFPFSVPSGSDQPVYIDIHVPRGTPAGVYAGTATVAALGQKPVAIPVALTVWGFTLPDQPALATDFLPYDRWLWLAASSVGADQAALEKSIWTALTEHRIGGEGGLGRWTGSAADRAFASSWLERQRLIPAPSSSTAAELGDFSAYLSSIGRGNDTFVRFADEPASKAAYDRINRIAPFWRKSGIRTQTTIAADTSWDAFDTDIWVPHHARLTSAEDLSAIRRKQASGEDIWSYYCCEARNTLPNWMLDFDLINFRIVPWLDYTSGFKGMLYWTTTYWTGGASAVWSNRSNGNGEGVLFYPGAEVGAPNAAIPSARLKAVRDGIQDFDYLALLGSLGAGREAKRLAASIAGAWDGWPHDPAKLESAREEAAALILRLGGDSDQAAPRVSITSPADHASVSGTIEVAAAAFANLGTAGVRFKLDGKDLGAEDTCAPYAVSWNTTGAADGIHSLIAIARDAAGKTSSSAAIPITVNNAAAKARKPAGD